MFLKRKALQTQKADLVPTTAWRMRIRSIKWKQEKNSKYFAKPSELSLFI